MRMNATAIYEQDSEERVLVRVKPFVNHQIVYGMGAKQKIGRYVEVAGDVETIRPDVGRDASFDFEEVI